MKIYLSHSTKFDYKPELYELLKPVLAKKHEIYFPHDNENINNKSKDIIAASDYVIAEVSFPSTGQGIELGWADANNIQIICFYRKGTKISSSLKFVSKEFFEYASHEEMLEKLETKLSR